ncbi:MAG: cupin domain-containing protein, partial [Bacteroidota bacterium]
AEMNGQQIKLAKVQGEFVWHDHAAEDELFVVFKGTLLIDFRDRTESISEGEILVVPKGIEHRPRTKDGEEVWLMLIEPIGTKHTGEVVDQKTVKEFDWI